MFSENNKKYNNWFVIILLITVFIFLTSSVSQAFISNSNHDEVEFLYHAYLVYKEGETIHVDTFSRIPPIIYYVYGPILYFFGPKIINARFFSIFLSLFTLFFTFEIVKKLTRSKWFGLLSLMLITSTQYVTNIFSLAISLALANFLISFSLYSFFKLKKPYNYYFSCIIMTVAVITRPNLALLLGILVLYIFSENTKIKNKIGCVLASIITSFLLLFNVLLKDWKLFFSQVVGFIFQKFAEFKVNHPNVNSYPGYFSFSSFINSSYYFINDVNELTIFFILSFFILLYFSFNRELFKKEVLARKEIFLILILFVFNYFLHRFGWRATSTNYVIYSVILWVILLVYLLKVIYKSIDNSTARKLFLFFLISLILPNLLLIDKDLIKNPLAEETDLAKIGRGAEILKNLTNKNDSIVILGEGTLHILFEADRRTESALTHSYFNFANSNDSKKLEWFGFYNEAMLRKWIEESDLVIVPEDKEFFKSRAKISYKVFEEEVASSENFNPPIIVKDVIPKEMIRSEDNDLEIYFKKKSGLSH